MTEYTTSHYWSLPDDCSRVLVCGGRDFTDRAVVYYYLDVVHRERGISYVITGAAKGADTLAAEWAGTNLIPAAHVRAEWETYGPKAGPMRNQRMLEHNPTVVAAFPGGKGTADMVRRATRAGIPVLSFPAAIPTAP